MSLADAQARQEGPWRIRRGGETGGYTLGIRVAPEPSGDLMLIAGALAVCACARCRS
jgi:hypothetical protein